MTSRYSQGKLCFPQFSKRSHWNRNLAASGHFTMFTQSTNFYTFYCHMLKSYRCLKVCDSSDRQK